MPYIDWPLTLFTVITQMALGAYAVLWATDLIARQLTRPEDQERISAAGVFLLGPLMALGLAFATLHLGRPEYAHRALSNLATSWLSREVFFVGVFFGMGALYALLWWRFREQFALRGMGRTGYPGRPARYGSDPPQRAYGRDRAACIDWAGVRHQRHSFLRHGRMPSLLVDGRCPATRRGRVSTRAGRVAGPDFDVRYLENRALRCLFLNCTV